MAKSDMPLELYLNTIADPATVLARVERQRHAAINLPLAKRILGTRPRKAKSFAYALNFKPTDNEDATEAASHAQA